MISKNKLLKAAADDEERLLMSKAADKANIAIKTFAPEFTVFTDPYKAHAIMNAFIHEDEVKVMAYGGYEDAERLKIGFFPEFTECTNTLFPITPVKISYNAKFSRQLAHRDILGSVLGLGIAREKTGDIIPDEGSAVIFTDSDIADYITANLERVGHTKVNVQMLEGFTPKPKGASEKRLTVASLRLDAVLSNAFNISRGKAAELIKGEKAYINWKNETSVSKAAAQGDIITLRGFGRIKIAEIMGTTKKDRILLRLIIFK